MYQNINLEIMDNIAALTINRPEKLNALNLATLNELARALTEIEQNDIIRGVMITGSGEKAFAAGADINEIAELSKETALNFSRQGQAVFSKLENLRIPVIAAVNGFALGGGCELALACHMRIAAENAKFGQPEVNLGIIPGFGGTQRLPRLVGKGMAMELCLSGNIIDAREALRIGLVNRITEAAEVRSATLALLDSIAQKGPVAVNLTIDSINTGTELPLDEALQVESQRFSEACSTADMKEGTSAFLEKRPAHFIGK